MSNDTDTMNRTSMLKETATTTTIILFLVIGITGLALLLGFRSGAVKMAHEWLGLAFVIAGVIHTWRHWRLVVRYLKRRNIWITTVMVAALTVALLLPASGGGRGMGPMAIIRAVASAPLSEVAPILDTTPENLSARLEAAGITVDALSDSLEQIAEKSGRHPFEVIGVIMASGPDGSPRRR